MPVDVSTTLRQALSKLEAERARIDRQMVAIQQALRVGGGGRNMGSEVPLNTPRHRRKRMSPARRKAVGARMKAYWAKRRSRASKGKRKKA